MSELAENLLPGLVWLLSEYRGPFTPEIEVQDAIEQILIEAEIPYTREADLDEVGRIDFLVQHGIGIEVKVDGSPASVAHQLWRYCKSPDVQALVLVTTKARLAPKVATILEKPIRIVKLWKAAF